MPNAANTNAAVQRRHTATLITSILKLRIATPNRYDSLTITKVILQQLIYLFISVYFTLTSTDSVHMSTAQCKKGSRGP